MQYKQNKKVLFRDLGFIDYEEAHSLQKDTFDATIAKKLANRQAEKDGQPVAETENHIFFCEHPHVYTLGKSGQAENLLINEKQLEEYGAKLFHIGRGGDITYHGPGQLVGYPILDLENFFTDIHKYLRLLEEAIIKTLAEYDIVAGRVDGLTGVWIDVDQPFRARKITAMGVRASRWVTMHGFALNVNTDLSYFGHIVPCGIKDKAVTSMQRELGREVPMQEVSEKVLKHIVQLFNMEIEEELA